MTGPQGVPPAPERPRDEWYAELAEIRKALRDVERTEASFAAIAADAREEIVRELGEEMAADFLGIAPERRPEAAPGTRQAGAREEPAPAPIEEPSLGRRARARAALAASRTEDDPRPFTPEGLATRWGLSAWQIRKGIASGKIPAIGLGRARRIPAGFVYEIGRASC